MQEIEPRINKVFHWVSMKHTLINEYNMTFKEVNRTPYVKCLFLLCHLIDKNRVQQEKAEQQRHNG